MIRFSFIFLALVCVFGGAAIAKSFDNLEEDFIRCDFMWIRQSSLALFPEKIITSFFSLEFPWLLSIQGLAVTLKKVSNFGMIEMCVLIVLL